MFYSGSCFHQTTTESYGYLCNRSKKWSPSLTKLLPAVTKIFFTLSTALHIEVSTLNSQNYVLLAEMGQDICALQQLCIISQVKDQNSMIKQPYKSASVFVILIGNNISLLFS